MDGSPEGLGQTVAEVYLEPTDGNGAAPPFRANLAVTIAGNDGQSFAEWQRTTDQVLPDLLDDYLAIDAERLEIGGREAGRRLAHHRGPSGEALTMEQWFVAVGGVGHTLTFTVDTPRFGAFAELFEDCAATWAPAEVVL